MEVDSQLFGNLGSTGMRFQTCGAAAARRWLRPAGREGREAVPSCSGEANARFRRGAVGARSPDGSIERYGCGHRVVARAVFLNVAVKQGKPRVALVGVHHELVIYATHA